MIDLGSYNDLILFDRGYPSKDFITFIESRKLKYLMRVSSGFLKVVVNAPKPDQIIEVKHKDKILKMRVIKLELESGIIETLVTNLFDETISLVSVKILVSMFMSLDTLKYPSKAIVSFTRINFISYL